MSREKLIITNHKNLRIFLDQAGYDSWSNKEIEDLYNDTTTTLFANSPRVVQITCIQSAVNTILKLMKNAHLKL